MSSTSSLPQHSSQAPSQKKPSSSPIEQKETPSTPKMREATYLNSASYPPHPQTASLLPPGSHIPPGCPHNWLFPGQFPRYLQLVMATWVESQNHFGWKGPLRSLRPTVNPALLSPSLGGVGGRMRMEENGGWMVISSLLGHPSAWASLLTPLYLLYTFTLCPSLWPDPSREMPACTPTMSCDTGDSLGAACTSLCG